MLILTIYVIKLERFKRFELTILIAIFLKYSDTIFIHFFSDYIMSSNLRIFVIYTLYYVVNPVHHWAFASQYIKTCLILPGLVQRARLLLERHLTNIEIDKALYTSAKDFLLKHSEIDADVQVERSKRKKIEMVFFIVDSMTLLVFLGLYGSLLYLYLYQGVTNTAINEVFYFMPLILIEIIAIVLTTAACYLSCILRK